MKVYSYATFLNETGNPYIKPVTSYNVDGRKTYNTYEDVTEFICTSLGIQNCAEEYLYVLCFDAKKHLIGCFEASHGTVNASLISNREIMQKSLMIGAVSIIITHNHPSGDCTPSADDIKATQQLINAGYIVGIAVNDHIIVSRESYLSLRDYNSGFFKKEV